MNLFAGSKKNILYAVLIILQLPALWYSLNTRFALVDDYGSWTMLTRAWKEWFGTVFFLSGTERFRPTFDIYNYITWAVFRENYSLHHLMRWLLKLSAAAFSVFTLKLFIRKKHALAAFVFLSLYLFYPNNVEARLAPVELLLVFSLAIVVYYLAKVLVKYKGDLGLLPKTEYAIFFVAFVLMMGSKEPALSIGFVCLLFLLAIHFKKKTLVLCSPLFFFWAYSFLRVYLQIKGNGYGAAPLTIGLVRSNVAWYSTSLFLIKTSPLVLLIFLPIAACMLMHPWRLISYFKDNDGIPQEINLRNRTKDAVFDNREPVFFIFLLACFISFYCATLTFFQQAIRYYYPLVYLLTLLAGVSFIEIEKMRYAGRRAFRAIVIIACFYFIFANYYDFMYQFATQYYTRLKESNMLAEVNVLLEKGESVGVVIATEAEDKVRIYFNNYLPFFKHTAYRMKTSPPLNLLKEDCYFVTPSISYYFGHKVAKKFTIDNVDFFIKWLPSFSGFFQFRATAVAQADDNVGGLTGWDWYICKNNHEKSEAIFQSARVIYEHHAAVRIPGRLPSAEVSFQLPFTIKARQSYVLDVNYTTAGEAAPYAIVVQQPYQIEGHLPLHVKLPLFRDATSMRFRFSPQIDLVSPLVTLRNWSEKGEFIVNNFSVVTLPGNSTDDHQ